MEIAKKMVILAVCIQFDTDFAIFLMPAFR